MTDQPIPIVCDMTDAPDTTEERLAEYRGLFGGDLVGRERTDTGIRFLFRARPGLADEIRDLAAREKAWTMAQATPQTAATRAMRGGPAPSDA